MPGYATKMSAIYIPVGPTTELIIARMAGNMVSIELCESFSDESGAKMCIEFSGSKEYIKEELLNIIKFIEGDDS